VSLLCFDFLSFALLCLLACRQQSARVHKRWWWLWCGSGSGSGSGFGVMVVVVVTVLIEKGVLNLSNYGVACLASDDTGQRRRGGCWAGRATQRAVLGNLVRGLNSAFSDSRLLNLLVTG